MAQWCINGQMIEVGASRMSAEDWTQGKGPRGGSVWTNTKTGEKRYGKENPGGSSKSGSKKNDQSASSGKSSGTSDSTSQSVPFDAKSAMSATREALKSGFEQDTSAGKFKIDKTLGDGKSKFLMGSVGDYKFEMLRSADEKGWLDTDIKLLAVYDGSGNKVFTYTGEDSTDSPFPFESDPHKKAVGVLFASVYAKNQQPGSQSPQKSNAKAKAKVSETPYAKWTHTGMRGWVETDSSAPGGPVHTIINSKGNVLARSSSPDELKKWVKKKKMDVSYPEDPEWSDKVSGASSSGK